jgi:mannose/fructose/N-acetylgalactosamine-specific phosphotransferase system component IIB
MIKLARIDDRLVHGQVAFTWVSSLGIDCLLVANDKVAKDEFQKMAMGLAKPPTAKLLIMTLVETIAFLNDPKSKNAKILLLVNSINDACILTNGVAEIKSVNFGGLRTKDGAKLISKAIAVSDEDITIIKLMLEKGIELEIRQVPTDKKQLVQNLI